MDFKHLKKRTDDEIYLLVGNKEFKEIIELDINLDTLLIAITGRETYLELGKIEIFLENEHINHGILSANGDFFKILDDKNVMKCRKPDQPKWLTDLLDE